MMCWARAGVTDLLNEIIAQTSLNELLFKDTFFITFYCKKWNQPWNNAKKT